MDATALSLDHVAIPVADMAASLDFYARAFGVRPSGAFSGSDWGGREWLIVILDLSPSSHIALTTFRPALTQALPEGLADARHYALATCDLNAWRRRLSDAGFEFNDEGPSIYVSDPDGVVWELTEPMRDVSTGNRWEETLDAWLSK